MWWQGNHKLTDADLLEAFSLDNSFAKEHVSAIRSCLQTFRLKGPESGGAAGDFLAATLLQKGLIGYDLMGINLRLEKEFWDRL